MAKAAAAGPVRQRIRKLNRQLDAEGQRRLRLCRQHCQKKDYAQAFTGYTAIVSEFPGRPCAAEARKALAAATAGNPERKQMLDEIQARKMCASIARMLGPTPACEPGAKTTAASRLAQIKAADADLKAEVIAELQKLARLYPKSTEGKRAAADLKALKAG